MRCNWFNKSNAIIKAKFVKIKTNRNGYALVKELIGHKNAVRGTKNQFIKR